MHRERIKRWILFFAALFFMGNGIAIVTNAQLGTTPISSLPFVAAKIFHKSMGTGTFIINTLLLLAQIPLMGKAFRPKQLLQLPSVLVFSVFIDLGMWLTQMVIPETWAMRMGMSLAGCAVMAFGITLEVLSDTMVIPGEGFVLALAFRTGINFGNLKIINDVTLVTLALLTSVLVLGNIEGIREGTVITAVLTGVFIKFFTRRMRSPILSWLRA